MVLDLRYGNKPNQFILKSDVKVSPINIVPFCLYLLLVFCGFVYCLVIITCLNLMPTPSQVLD